MLIFQLVSYLFGTIAFKTKSEDFLNNRSGFLIYYPLIRVIGTFHISIRRNITQRLARFAFRFCYCSDFLAGILSKPLIHYIYEWRKIAVRLLFAVNSVIDCDESNSFFNKKNFGIVKLRNKVSQLTGTLFDKICIFFKEGYVNYARTTNTS